MNSLTTQHERFQTLLAFDSAIKKRGIRILAGVDEAGRGPLAGPVVAAACILPDQFPLSSIDDSKKLSAMQRQALYEMLTSHPDVYYGVGIVSSEEIDSINIYQATIRAMLQAIYALELQPELLLVDGMSLPGLSAPTEKVIGGDAKSLSIAAASIIAKETRDRLMLEYHKLWPHYGFDRHKGYGTERHLEAIGVHGITPIHRLSFAPCRAPLVNS